MKTQATTSLHHHHFTTAHQAIHHCAKEAQGIDIYLGGQPEAGSPTAGSFTLLADHGYEYIEEVDLIASLRRWTSD